MFDQSSHTTPTPISKRRALAHLTRVPLVLAMIVSLLSLGSPDKAQASSDCLLDPTFNHDGKQTTDFFHSEDAADMVIQPDGKIIVVGDMYNEGIIVIGPLPFHRFALARYNPDGQLDKSFGQLGKVVTDFGYSWPSAVALQTDGKILVAGITYVTDERGDFALARYNPDGYLDPTFGDGGWITTDFFGGYDVAHAVATQPDGKILLAGSAAGADNIDHFALARYNADGHLDMTFGDAGQLVTVFAPHRNSQISDIALQPDGEIIAVGSSVLNPFPVYLSEDFALARYNPDGQLDTTFGGDGKIIRRIGRYNRTGSVALQPDGKIVVAVSVTSGNYKVHAGLMRYKRDGQLDQTFGSDGVAYSDLFNANDMALQPDGKIIVVGQGSTLNVDFNVDFEVTRFLPDGHLDTNFGSGGKILTDFLCFIDTPRAVALQPDGKIVVSGKTLCGATGSDFALARYPADPTSAQPSLLSVTLHSSIVPGCPSLYPSLYSYGQVTLCAPAPPGGLEVKLTDTLEAAAVQESVWVEAGESSAWFGFTTTPVTSTQVGTVVATLNGTTRSTTLTVRPIAVASLNFYSNPVDGPGLVQGIVILDCQAPRGGLSVQLSSLNPGVASPVESRVRVLRGSDSASFTVRTADVTAPRSAIITATVNGITKRSVLRVY